MSLIFDYFELISALADQGKPFIPVVTGATGINGNAMVSYLSHFPQQVPLIIALSTSTKSITESDWCDCPHVRHLALDLLNEDDVSEKIEAHKNLFMQATHLFHTAYVEKLSADEMIQKNMTMLKNIVEGLEKVTKLDHIALIDGTLHLGIYEEGGGGSELISDLMSKLGDKYYGSHLGPHKTPYREEDPRPDIDLFYYNQEDYLKARHKLAGWTYSILR